MSAGYPLVSVGMPVYNGERHLREALDSLLGQDYPNVEIVIADNASTDGTAAICAAYAARDARVRYVRHETNRGIAWNFNRVFALSRGEYFMWAACDNVLAPSLLRKCIDALEGHRDASLCHAQCGFISEDGRPLGGPHANYEATGVDVRARWKRVLNARAYPAWYTAIYGVIRASCLRRTGLVRAVWGADQLLVAELSLQGPLLQVPELLWWLRHHDDATEPESIYQTVMGKLDPWRPRRARRWTQFGMHREYIRVALRAPCAPRTRYRLAADVAANYVMARGWLSDLDECGWAGAPLRWVRTMRRRATRPCRSET